MTARRDPDRLIRTYLDDGPTELADRSYEAVRAQIDHTRQRVVFGPWREPDMSRYVAFAMAAAAILVVAVVVGINFMPQRDQVGSPAGPTPAALTRNGAIVYSDAAGDIHSLDPETGKTTLLIGGPTNDRGPGFVPDGQRFIFVRLQDDGDILYSAKPDGSDVQKFADGKELSNWEYSPSGDRIASLRDGGGNPTITDLASGSRRVIPLTKPVNIVSWLTDDSLLIADVDEGGSAVEMWTINADGTRQQAIAAPSMCCGVSTLRGRGLVAWTSWVSGSSSARIHILDTATGEDTVLASTNVPGGSLFLDPNWSPDGKWLTAKRLTANVDGVQLALIAADGSGEAMSLGPRQTTNSAQIGRTFSPDGTQLLVTYEDGSAWLFDVPSGTGGKTDWQGLVETTWHGVDVPN